MVCQLKTTNKDYQHFKTHCNNWIKAFGLTDWEISFSHCDIEEDTLSDIVWDIGQRSATIRFSKDSWNNANTHREIEKTACHEIGHLLTARMFCLAQKPGVMEEELVEESHTIIARLVNYLFQ